jgi:hypothetical protein
VYPWSASTILLLDDTACPTRSNILYAAYTGGNNSGEMRPPQSNFSSDGSTDAGCEHKRKCTQNRGTGRHEARMRGQMWVQAKINRAVFGGVY